MDWAGKTALVRVDFNVPMKDGAVADDTRIRAAVPTLHYLREHGARVVLMSHLGRPDGQVNLSYTLAPIARRTAELLHAPCGFAEDCVGELALTAVRALQPGGMVLLENVRFHAGEEENDPAFAQQLAALGDVFVNDAFGTAHRAHASTEGLARYLPAVAGFLMEKEVSSLTMVLDSPERPFAAIVGGAKVSSKLGVLKALIDRVDALIIGGGMANTFLAARGENVGKSLLEKDLIATAEGLVQQARARDVALLLPLDVVVTTDISGKGPVRTCLAGDVGPDEMIVDVGPESIRTYEAEIARARTILWNGPMGVFEVKPFARGTLAVAHALARSTGATVVGGGESVQAVEAAGVADRLTHVSTGGGATLELIEGRVLPGVAALRSDCA